MDNIEVADSGHPRVRVEEVQNAHSNFMTTKEETEKVTRDNEHPQAQRQLTPKLETTNRTGTRTLQDEMIDLIFTITRKGSA